MTTTLEPTSLFSHALAALAKEPSNLLLQRHSLQVKGMVLGAVPCFGQANATRPRSLLCATPQSLPEHAANQLLAYLVESGQLTTSHLHLFRSTATQALFSGVLVDGHLLAYLSEFQHLHVLRLSGCQNLKVGACPQAVQSVSLEACDNDQHSYIQASHLNALSASTVPGTLRVLVSSGCCSWHLLCILQHEILVKTCPDTLNVHVILAVLTSVHALFDMPPAGVRRLSKVSMDAWSTSPPNILVNKQGL